MALAPDRASFNSATPHQRRRAMLKRTRRLPRLLTARPLPVAEFPVLAAVLGAASLPTQDRDEPGREFFAFSDPRGTLVGYGGIAVIGANALLQSVITVPEMRDRGYGMAIVDRMLALALRRGVHTLYLLTTTAVPFFDRLGFAAIDRAEAPPGIAATREFATYCSGSAVLMCRRLV
jgi:N-acetylglutamate synthase-like GNAT family acetyltransferase